MDADLVALSEAVGTPCRQRRLLLATAESCTGGWAAQVITHTAGSSEWFDRGFVTYSNEAKINLLGVTPETLQQFGAVSQETAAKMAEGALKNSKALISLAITGIAGPTGGSAEKPVGTVWISVASGGTIISEKFNFGTNRERNIRRASLAALNMLRNLLETY